MMAKKIFLKVSSKEYRAVINEIAVRLEKRWKHLDDPSLAEVVTGVAKSQTFNYVEQFISDADKLNMVVSSKEYRAVINEIAVRLEKRWKHLDDPSLAEVVTGVAKSQTFNYVEQFISDADKLNMVNLEVVPLFGDMQIAPFNYVKRSKNYDMSKWPLCAPCLCIVYREY
ncbi:hypothetical protein QYM36_016105 [Artemia franciscana]|uniref:Uncharacterized protein n=1 Tax=Artemia franciscana TaxID=6661 RepID=A0AA88KW45_ARTSF|nr:hypothetical protein QYM36_016105 [Artemia franciscana]